MGSGHLDPGGRKVSYANSLKSNMKKYEKLERNVLLIEIEKKIQNAFVNLNGDLVADICQVVGIKPGVETEGYQVHYGKGVTVAVWAKQAINLERYVTEERRDFNNDLVITSVRPAVRKEVLVLVSGLSFNTPDEQVKDYISCFGAKLAGGEPVYGVHKNGPWKGQYNGERRYRADFSSQVMPMGTYHLIGGDKVRVFYPGNVMTCGRCHKPPNGCPGAGIAKVCSENGGQRKTLFAHMKSVWDKIGYVNDQTNGDHEDETEKDNTNEQLETPDDPVESSPTSAEHDDTVLVDESGTPVINLEESQSTFEDGTDELFNKLSVPEKDENDEVTFKPSKSTSIETMPCSDDKSPQKQETEDIKRKADGSPELSKKEKKKIRNQEKTQRKQEVIESRRLKIYE